MANSSWRLPRRLQPLQRLNAGFNLPLQIHRVFLLRQAARSASFSKTRASLS